MARPSINYEHGSLHGAGAEPVQGFLAGLSYGGRRGRRVLDGDAISLAAIKQPPAFFAVIVCGVDKAAINPIFHGAPGLDLIAKARLVLCSMQTIWNMLPFISFAPSDGCNDARSP
jgi:hypothetical protein